MPLALLLLAASAASAAPSVPAAAKPGEPFVAREVRLLADLPPLDPDASLNRFGGRRADPLPATGFFRTHREGGVWWLVDPEGGRFLHRGVSSVNRIPTPGAKAALSQRFGDQAAWAEATADLLRAAGFNGTGAWSADGDLAAATARPVRTQILSLMSGYGKRRGGTFMKPGHLGYPGDCPFIFDPGFEAYCKEACASLAAQSKDPWLLGYYTDNELPWSREMLPRYLRLPPGDPGRRAAEAWLAERGASPAALTDALKDGFLEFAAERYFQVTAAAIRAADPNHLVLGARFHGGALRLGPLFRAAGRHCDVLSVNYYRVWTPDPELMRLWSAESRRPFLVTEWYAKGVDSGMANHSGAGWLVRTQADRGRFYQHFALGLLAEPACVGWHWFRYADNDPDQPGTDPSNLDSNKGIVTNRYAPYAPLLEAMTELNRRAYGLRERALRPSPMGAK